MLTIYKASAGSGKTYNLAKYYIKFLLGIKNKDNDTWQLNLDRKRKTLKISNRHRGILAITFTRKATEEMKQRIVGKLADLVRIRKPDEKEADYVDGLMADLHCSREELSRAAELTLQQLLFDYQNFNVSTIDAFFQRVLHTFAREIDIQTDYQVELNDTQAMQTAVGEMLDDFNTASPLDPSLKKNQLGRWLYDYMRSLIYEGKKADFLNRDSYAHSTLVDLVAQISLESFKPFKDDMRVYLDADNLGIRSSTPSADHIIEFTQAIDDYKRYILAEIKRDAQTVLCDPADPVQIDKLGTSRSKKPQIIARDYLLRGRPYRKMDDWTSTKVMLNLVSPDAEVNFAPGGDVVLKGETEDHARAAKGLFERTYARYCVYYAIESISAALTQLGLLRHAWGYLSRLMEDNNLVLISDTNELLAKVIGGDETPFVYERMGLQLVHHLIDEFQDTSKMQWANLLPLVSIGIHDREDSLIIGDEKQSIYRFRNSDSSILHDGLEKQFDHSQLELKGNIPKENTNYRSSSDVVRFNNTLFSHLAGKLGVVGYDNVAQGIDKEHPGHVKFIATAYKEDDQTILDAMKAEIRRMVDDGGYDYKDIAVLGDTNKHCASVVDYLVKEGLPVLSDEALFLYKSWAVQLVINTLKIIDREQSGEANRPETDKRMRATNAQMHNVLSQFEILVKDGAATPAQAINQAMRSLDKCAAPAAEQNKDAEISANIKSILDRRPSSLAALIETVIEVQMPDADARRAHSAYLSALQDAAMQFAAKNRNKDAASLHAFLDWWDANPRLAIGGASEANAIKVMTIHKSKGLEFPCVLIPFCTWDVAWTDGFRTPAIWTDSLKSNIDVLNSAATAAGLQHTLDISKAPPALYVKLDKRTRLPQSPFNSDFQKEWDQAINDTLNKTYVAFTRATTELIVWAEVPSKLDGALTNGCIGLPIALACGLGRPADVPEDLCLDLSAHKVADNPDILAEIGEPTVKVLSDKEKEELKEKEARDRLAIDVGYDVEIRSDVLSITSIKEEEAEVIDKEPEPQSAIKDEGTLLHEIMQYVAHASDLPRAVKMVTSRHGIDPATAAEYEQMLARFLADERVSHWFDGYKRIYIEQPIYIPGIQDGIRRPDRVVVNPDGSVDVLDYKFGESAPEEYYPYVRRYMEYMRSIGHDRVRGFILYPRQSAIYPV